MKAVGSLILICVIVSLSFFPVSVVAHEEPSVGVVEGDWIEYDVKITGEGAMPPTHDVRWFRIEVLPVQGTAFSVNLTSRYTNGTLNSAIWKFNFTEGNVEGWIIIPSNLSQGDTFYDYSIHTGKPVNVVIQKEEQQTVLGANRIVTYGNDSFRHKEWDKATGVFIATTEVYKNVTTKSGWFIDDLTVTVCAVATNMWDSQSILEVSHSGFNSLVVVIGSLALILSLLVVIVQKKKEKNPFLHYFSQGKIAILIILLTILFEILNMIMSPFYEMGLSFAEINLIMQTLWTALVIVSIWFRMRGNYFVHEILMLIVICAWWVGFSAVLFMDPFSTSTEVFSNTPFRLVMNGLHAIFSIPALFFGTWLVAIWRPKSISFAEKSRRISQLTIMCWIPSYVVGVLDFLVLHTTFFG